MIKLKEVSKFYYQSGVIAQGFSKVDLELHIGEFVVITGESGSGKSSLLNVISGLDTYEEGEMYINGEETSHYTESDFLNYRKKYVTNIFQNFNLVNSYSVYQNIELALLLDGFNKHEVKNKVLDLIDTVGLKKFKNTKVSKLSGGQKQRVAIARALAYDTPIIVADEPTGSLDSKQSKSILELLHKISENKLVIVVTHNKKEIEEYATRLIRMHDGHILENKELNKVNKDSSLVDKSLSNLTFISKLRIGLRNTFNLPIKFVLLFLVFFFITFSFTSEYASLESSKYDTAVTGYNEFFSNTDIKRIIITKKDKSPILESDFNNIQKIDNIDYIVKNDVLNDLHVGIYEDNYYFYGLIKNVEQLDSVDIGRMPQNEHEVVICNNKNAFYFDFKDIEKEIFVLENNNNGVELDNNIKIVGIKYSDTYQYDYSFYVSNELIDGLKVTLNESYSNTSIKVNETTLKSYAYDQMNKVTPNEFVKDNEALVSYDLNGYCKYSWCMNKVINISTKNIYYEESLDLKVTNLYNKSNFKTLTGLKQFDRNNGNIFISYNDYNKLFNKDTYQSSVFVKDDKLVDETSNELNKLGLSTLNMKDALANQTEGIAQLFHIFKLVLTIILLVGLFFISYFVIKIILKFRSSYYATIRTLGGTKKVCINLLMIELIFNSSVAYILFAVLSVLVNTDVIVFEKMKELLTFVDIKDYVLVYLLLIFMVMLISLRYGRKLFKDSVIKIYGERV